ncbi:MAG: hypothetical protein ACJ8CR_39385 [Roseiflexaceae bacterium]
MAVTHTALNNAAGLIQLSEVPLNLHRRAAQLLEDMRSGKMAPGWERAQLGSVVTPLYRPDIDGAAYFEFLVVPPAGETGDLGFIIVSTGEHDFPIAHWNYIGESPTQELARKAREKGQEAVKFYKLDALSYAAEDAQGQLVSSVGGDLVKVSGQDPAWLDQPAEVSEASWTPDQQGGGTTKTSGPKPSTALKLSAWGSWAELQAGYRASYQVQIESLRRQASPEWETDRLAEQAGEGLQQGQTYTLALLYPDAQYTLSGAGAKSVQAELLVRDGLPPAVQITVLQAASKAELPLDVTIAYPNGLQETVTFVIVPSTMSKQGDWSLWHEYWAGTGADQRLYNQILAGSPPNTSECYSGCGATAWAMLFGWADHQAARGNPTWAWHWGIYRQNGGYGADADAPQLMDTGVSSMTWELRQRIGTFCWNGLGATAPWNMWSSYGYLVNRSPMPVVTHYNAFGVATDDLRSYASASIANRGTPAIIGTGWLSHYPLAYGYHWRSRIVRHCSWWQCWNETEYQHEFYVNQGWGGSGNGWVPASTWFAGEIYP